MLMPGEKKHIRYRPVRKEAKRPAPPVAYSPLFTGCPAVELVIERLYQAGDADREDRFWALIRGLNYALQMRTEVLVPLQLSAGVKRTQTSWARDPIPPERAAGLPLWPLKAPREPKMLPVFTRPEQADGNPITLGLPMAQLPLQLLMEQILADDEMAGMVVNPWGRSAALDKSILRGLLCAQGESEDPGEAENRQGRDKAAAGDWEAAQAHFAAAAALGSPEGLRRLAGCYDRGRGVRKDRRRAMTLWRQAAAAGDPLAQVALGDRYAAGTARTPGDPGKALMAYRKARAMAELEMDISTWPVVCLRMAEAEAHGMDLEQEGKLLAEAVRGLELLCAEEEDPDAREELDRAGRDLHAYLLGISAGAAAIQKLLERLDAHNTESLHLS